MNNQSIPTNEETKRMALEVARYPEYLSKLDLYQKAKIKDFIRSEIKLIRIQQRLYRSDDPIQDELRESSSQYGKALLAIMKDEIDRVFKPGSFLKTNRQIGGFYYYLEATGENHDFHELAEEIVAKYITSNAKSPGKKAKEYYNSFHEELNRQEGTHDNITDLQVIMNELRRLGKDTSLIESDLRVAKEK